jgi:tRNA threonylcarbamoyl adenosine modification protein YeaZ
MKTLFLDTASNENLLALCDEKKTLVIKSLKKMGDAELIPAIEDVLKEVGWEYKDLTNLACAIGPGGFTSLRVGVTAINTLAYSLDIPSAGMHLSDLWAKRVQRNCHPERALNPSEASGEGRVEGFLWLHSTRKTSLFVRGFGTDGTITPTGLLEMDEAVALQGPYVGELIPEHKEALTRCEPLEEGKIESLDEMLPKYLSELKYQKQQLVPWYGREG